MTAEVLLIVFSLCLSVFTAVAGVSTSLSEADRGLFALERQYRVFRNKKPKAKPYNVEKEKTDEDVVFKTENLCYSYKGDKLVLDNVSIEIKKGETIALVGTHDELMAKNGRYTYFFNEQAQWYKKEEEVVANG